MAVDEDGSAYAVVRDIYYVILKYKYFPKISQQIFLKTPFFVYPYAFL